MNVYVDTTIPTMEFILEDIELKADPHLDLDPDPDCITQEDHTLINSDWKLDPHVECRVLLERLEISPSTQESCRDSDEPAVHSTNEDSADADVYFKFKLLVEELSSIFTKCEDKCGTCVEYIVKLCQHMAETHEGDRESGSTSFDFKCDICCKIFSSSSESIRHRESHSNSESSETVPVNISDSNDRSQSFNVLMTTIPILILTPETETVANNYPSQNISLNVNDNVDLSHENGMNLSTEDGDVRSVAVAQSNVPQTLIIENVNVNSFSTTMDITSTNETVTDDASECQEVFRSLHHSNVRKISIKKFTCEKCGKDFALRGAFTNHMMKKHGVKKLEMKRTKPFKCETCGKCFYSNHHLSTHKLVHTGERHFKCGECEKSYTRLSGLKAHQLFHAGEKPFKCDMCGQCYHSIGDLNAHRKKKSHGPRITQSNSSLNSGEKPLQDGTGRKTLLVAPENEIQNIQHTGESQTPSIQDFINVTIINALSNDNT